MTPSLASLASVLHEIRTPIQTILGTTELLKTTSLDPEQQEYVRQIAFSADVIYTLANDILDFEKLRTGNLRLEHIEYAPVDIVEQVLNLVSIEAYNKGIELLSYVEPTLPKKLCGDPLRLQQILLNMVKNAVKFTPKGYISVRIQRQDQNTLIFRVIDSGVGIPQDKKPGIFQAFTQASDSTTRQYGGSGLGLNICAQLVALMKGSIGVQDNPGGGSIFYFSIPLEKVPQQDTPQKLSFPEGNRILVVDDNQLYLEHISAIIQNISNLQITTASSGEEALAVMREAATQKKDFTLVLMGLGMPPMDGWRLAAEINSDPSINGAKLYLMIPEGQLGGEAKMKLLSWFNGYLYKPVMRKKLWDLLSQSFEQPLELPSVEKLEQKHTAQLQENQIAGMLPSPIIAVDDHPVNLKILTTFLTSLGVEAHGATSGQDALQLFQQHHGTKMVFMDIEMPFMNGFQTSSKLREAGFTGTIIACSANSAPDIVQEYIQSGINDYLSKPFKKQQLAELLKKWSHLMTDSTIDIQHSWMGPQEEV